MPSKKKISDLEYNVFNGGRNTSDTDDFINEQNRGCVTVLGGIIVTVLILVIVLGFMQIGRNGPAPNCAAPGCSNRLKAGSNYCWLHSKSVTKHRRNEKNNSSSDSSNSGTDGGSVIDGASDKKTEGKSDSYSSSGSTYSGSGSSGSSSGSTYGGSSSSGSSSGSIYGGSGGTVGNSSGISSGAESD